ncbi:MAG: fenitrothion hydrolase [Solirubrobacterales bacterium]
MIVLAHGLGERADLPLPGWLFAWAAAAVLAISFFAFAAMWQTPKLETATPTQRFRIPGFLVPLCGLVGVAVLAFLVYAGFAGDQDPSTNIVPTFVYVYAWSVLPIASALFGDVFRAFNPWLAVGRAAGWIKSKVAPNALPAPFNYPESLGRWPAVVLLFAFGWIELIAESGRDPSFLAWMIIAYSLIQVSGMALVGTDRWSERGDAFNLYYNMFSRIAPLTVQEGRVCTRLPLSGLTDIQWLPATVMFFCASIGITAFDGASEGALWQSVGGTDPSGITSTLGLLVAIGIVFGFYRLGVEGMRSSHIEMSARELSQTFAPSLVPIMLGYVVAHYFSFIVFQGQALWPLLSDPLGNGSDIFGTAASSIDYRLVSSQAIWYVQVLALVAGHVAGLAVAHDKALSVWGKARAAVQSQLWMLVVMVGFTSLGLWLLSQANQ